MKVQMFTDYYIKEVNKIPEKFEKIYEISKSWVKFSGKELHKPSHNPYSDLEYYRQAGGDFKIFPCYDNKIGISWEGSDDIYIFEVTDLFFDDFDKYLEGVFERVEENNKKQAEKFQEYLKHTKELEKQREQEQYQEFLRLKKIYEPKV
jgi:hypothetical protein